MHVDASFAGGWTQAKSDDQSNIMYITGFILSYVHCTMLQISKLQTEITLSTTEAKYIPLLQSMRDVIQFMTLHKKVAETFNLKMTKPNIYCSVFEDNNGILELTKSPKICPHTKHINLKYQHCRSYIKNYQHLYNQHKREVGRHFHKRP